MGNRIELHVPKKHVDVTAKEVHVLCDENVLV